MRPLAPWLANHSGAALEQLAHPVQRLEVVLQRRPAEQADLRHVGRAQPRHAALAFDRFDHRGLFAADVGAGAAAQLDARQARRGRVGLQAVEFLLQQRAAAVVLVAQVDVDGVDAHGPGGDQHAFEEAVRVALEVDAVLEGAGLALVDVHGHQARRRLLAHDAPLAAGREARAAQAAQARGFHRRDDRFDVALAAPGTAPAAGSRRPRGTATGRCSPRARAGCCLRAPARRRVCGVAQGTGFWPTTAAGACSQRPMQGAAITRTSRPSRAGSFCSSCCAPASSQERPSHTRTVSACGRLLAFLDDVEVVVEGRDLVHLASAPAASPRARAARCGAERWPKWSCSLCRCSISRSGRRGASPSSWRTSASACASARRPFGPCRFRCRGGTAAAAMGITRFCTLPLTAGPRRGPTGTSRPGSPPGSRWSRHRRGCRARTGTARLPRLRRRRRATRPPA